MPSNQTPNYTLSQWSKDDRVLMDDFNADNAKIDAAIKAVDQQANSLAATLTEHAALLPKLGNCQVYHVSYTGSYAGLGDDTPRTLTFPERPLMVFLLQINGGISICVYGLNMTRVLGYGTDTPFSISWNGNSLSWPSTAMNTNGDPYQAIAFCSRD